ncbi:hypothetical protein ABT336_11595 [Micromonospora sp. NPDC000207]|uniref:hypothetical protein n=1 Tax=Micromonospora sp. NPDC000207 TaxID=3154246 RepID=UPI00331D0E88
MTGRDPLLVRLAWAVLLRHRSGTCPSCTGNGHCPRVEVSRIRIRAWRRYGS